MAWPSGQVHGSLKKRFRLTARSDFQRLLTGRRLYSGTSLLGFATPGRTAQTRVGVSTSRQIRGAVARNRARRRLREAVRLRLLSEGLMGRRPGIILDVVLIARPPALRVPFTQIEAEVGEFASRLDRSI